MKGYPIKDIPNDSPKSIWLSGSIQSLVEDIKYWSSHPGNRIFFFFFPQKKAKNNPFSLSLQSVTNIDI